jgi:D-sedoheptulose 7-phosphate isomerase
VDQKSAISFIENYASSASEAVASVAKHAELLSELIDRLVECVQAGNRIYSCGNGGSACDSMHLTEELVARYLRERPGIAAHHLQDAGTITCWSNDYEYETAFKRQVETLVRDGDFFFAFSTSGNSKNVCLALEAAKKQNAGTVLLSGGTGGAARSHADFSIIIDSSTTSHVQEAHITLVHIICDLLEQKLFFDSPS